MRIGREGGMGEEGTPRVIDWARGLEKTAQMMC